MDDIVNHIGNVIEAEAPSNNVFYKGGIRPDGRRFVDRVEVDDDDNVISLRPLNPRLDLVNHSPDGFAWGYGGSGPTQLAVAMAIDAHMWGFENAMLHASEDDCLDPKEVYNVLSRGAIPKLKDTIIAKLDQDKPFTVDANDVLRCMGEVMFEELINFFADLADADPIEDDEDKETDTDA